MRTETNPDRILQEILSIPSVTGSTGEFLVCTYLASLFDRFGVKNQIVMTDSGRANLIASIEGKDTESCIVLNGHLDTVPHGNAEDWQTPPNRPVIQGDNVFCRGASDMKSGLAAMVSALCWLSENNVKPGHSILFLATCDEERSGEGARWVKKQGFMHHARFLIIAEPTDNRIALAEKGCLWLKFKFKGKTSHSAYPEEGVNAYDYGFRFISRLRDFVTAGTDELLGKSTMSITQVIAGIADNMVPDQAEFHLDIRTIPSLPVDSIVAEIERLIVWLRTKESQVEVSYEILNKRNALGTSQDNPRVQDFLSYVPGDTEIIGINYYTDASLLDEDGGIPFLIFGPGYLKQMHKANECCSLGYFHVAYQVFRDYLKDC